ncbi:MAG: cytochrome C [Deltaproteobacteria bacterium]|nr:cytochrome C [Deltaproteobacteria bacterium]
MARGTSRHYVRIGLLLLGGVIGFFIVRALLIPPSFGQFGFFRGDNVAEQRDRRIRFAAKEFCATCHDEVRRMHQQGKHAGVQCQNCHDAASVHVDPVSGEMVGAMPIQRSAQWCLRCHAPLPSRPADFPQIDPEEHAGGIASAPQSEACLQCHVPHDPTRMPSDAREKKRP